MTINTDEPVPLTCSDEEIDRLKEIAGSTTAGILRIKRAKALLGILNSISPARLMYQVRVPVKSIVKCIEDFKNRGMAYFDEPGRNPTERESRVERMLAFLDDAPPFHKKAWDDLSLHYIGMDFSARQIFMIREIIVKDRIVSPTRIAHLVCDRFGLQGHTGKPPYSKVVDILRRMAMDNIIFLPDVRDSRRPPKVPPKIIVPPEEIRTFVSREPMSLTIQVVEGTEDSLLWNSMIHHYHYIPGHRLFGPQLRYIVYCRNDRSAAGHPLAGQPLAALGFSSCAWRVACRDAYIGWNGDQRLANLRMVINNSRFLILPWIRVPNLASRVLGAVARQVPGDWDARYAIKPVLLETFVERERFSGTCYKAANWVEVGRTVGYSLHGREVRRGQPPRSVFLLPLHRRFRDILCGRDV
ncbi:MAG: Druantia anti-phage system protein DruA [Syntrophobacteraceae bacterium]